MRRTYNTKISERANRSLSRRETQVRIQKCFIAIFIILVISLGILLGTGIHVFAGNNETQMPQKYYKSICVEAGDTLWDIAGEYADALRMSRKEYVDEVRRLNGIDADEIHAGEYIVIIRAGSYECQE